MNKGFFFRRLGFIIPCILRLSDKNIIALSNKHNISSFQDVYLNPFYWEALLQLSFIPKNVFDLGANFGFFTSLCRQVFSYKKDKLQIPYTLIEANQDLVGTLKNQWEHHTDITIKYGAAGPNENIFFENNRNNLLASKISNHGKEVPFIDFNLLPKPDLLKIDIEGAEDLLFNNYFEWIKFARAIIIEFHYSDERLLKNMAQLQDNGFEMTLNRLEESGYSNQLWIKKEF